MNTANNLIKLANYIEMNVPQEKLDMSSFRAKFFINKHDCGTSGCALGWAPFVEGLEPVESDFDGPYVGLDFWQYSERVFPALGSHMSADWEEVFDSDLSSDKTQVVYRLRKKARQLKRRTLIKKVLTGIALTALIGVAILMSGCTSGDGVPYQTQPQGIEILDERGTALQNLDSPVVNANVVWTLDRWTAGSTYSRPQPYQNTRVDISCNRVEGAEGFDFFADGELIGVRTTCNHHLDIETPGHNRADIVYPEIRVRVWNEDGRETLSQPAYWI